MIIRRRKQQPGVVLLLALLLLAAVTASTIGTALTISSTTSQSTNLDNFILASLAGDTGMERSLAIVKYYRQSGTIVQALNTITSANATPQNIGTSSRGQFQGTARQISDPIIVPSLKPNEDVAFDIFKYNATSGVIEDPETRYLYIKGSPPADAAPWKASVELSWILIDANGDTTCTGRHYVTTSTLQAGTSPYLLNEITDQQGVPCKEVNPKGFRVRVRAIDLTGLDTMAEITNESISNLTIEAYPCDIVASAGCGSPAGIPGRIQIDVTGSTGNSKALKSARVLWQLPASGLFNYVLFTENDIIPN